MIYVQVLGGFVLLLGAAEVMVRGAVALADRLGISKMVIGMTVVAVGTSAPELVVSLDAALSGAPGLAVGNVVGSNIANVLLVLGGAGVVRSLQTKEGALHVDCGVLFGGTILFIIIAYSGTVGRLPGVFLLIVFFGFLWNSYRREKGGGPDAELHEEEMEEIHSLPKAMALAWGYLIVGIAGIILGADLLVDGGVQIARNFGVSDEVIGLTLFAVGTSLPELGASVVAAYRGHTDVAIGNVVGRQRVQHPRDRRDRGAGLAVARRRTDQVVRQLGHVGRDRPPYSAFALGLADQPADGARLPRCIRRLCRRPGLWRVQRTRRGRHRRRSLSRSAPPRPPRRRVLRCGSRLPILVACRSRT